MKKKKLFIICALISAMLFSVTLGLFAPVQAHADANAKNVCDELPTDRLPLSSSVCGAKNSQNQIVAEFDGHLRANAFVIWYRVSAECEVHYYLIAETVLIIAFIVLCILGKRNNRNALAIGGLLAFGALTFSVSFFARCTVCTVLLIVNAVLIAGALIWFVTKAKPKDDDTKDEPADDQK